METLNVEHRVYIVVCEKNTHGVYTFGHTSYNAGKPYQLILSVVSKQLQAVKVVKCEILSN